MILVLERGASAAEREALIESMRALGLEGHALGDGEQLLVHVVDGPTRRARRLLAWPRVVALVPTSGPRIRREGRRFYPYHFIGRGAAALCLVGSLVFLAGLFPPGVREGADPLASDGSGALELPWYVLPARGIVRLAPEDAGWIAWALAAVLVALFAALPWIARGRGGRGLATALALAATAAVCALGAWGARP